MPSSLCSLILVLCADGNAAVVSSYFAITLIIADAVRAVKIGMCFVMLAALFVVTRFLFALFCLPHPVQR